MALLVRRGLIARRALSDSELGKDSCSISALNMECGRLLALSDLDKDNTKKGREVCKRLLSNLLVGDRIASTC
jgi:hypothetical protein